MFFGCASGCPNGFTGPLLVAFSPLLDVMKSPINNSPARSHHLLFLCLHPPPLKLHFSPLLYCFLFCHPLCFCSSLPALFLSPGSLVILVASLCPRHSLVLFCSGVTHCISSLYITPLTGSLFMSAFSVWLAKTTIKQTNNRSCCSWKTKKLKKIYTKFLPYL